VLGINGGEFLLLIVVALVVVGPERLPRYAEQLGAWVRTARAFAMNARTRVTEELGEDVADVDWAALDPRRYDPRRIVREALLDDTPPPAPAPRPTGAPRAGGRPVAPANAAGATAAGPTAAGAATAGAIGADPAAGDVAPHDSATGAGSGATAIGATAAGAAVPGTPATGAPVTATDTKRAVVIGPDGLVVGDGGVVDVPPSDGIILPGSPDGGVIRAAPADVADGAPTVPAAPYDDEAT